MKPKDLLCEIRDLLKLQAGDYVDVQGDTTPVSIKSDLQPVRIAQVNMNRTELWLHNSSASVLHIGLRDDITTGQYALRIASYDTLILNANTYRSLYKREVYGFWETGADGSSKCMVTEFYQQN